MITGESIPVEKKVDDEVIGGTLNKTGSFRFKATRVGKDTALATIIRMVKDAQGSKAPIDFVPVIAQPPSGGACSRDRHNGPRHHPSGRAPRSSCRG
jgi:hypothetical protein